MDLVSAVVTLFLIMDPLGNVPLFLSVLRAVPPERRRFVLAREIGLAYLVLLVFLFAGSPVTHYLHLQSETISIAGGIVLFLIALRMIFPGDGLIGEPIDGEPFLVPLAIPLLAGPSTLAALLLLEGTTASTGALLAAVTIAWAISGAILLASTFFYRVLRERGLVAMERLMGMVLVMVAVQMFIDGVKVLLAGNR
ncbi:MAG TPA: YhgN family NAAT transporter [Vicinamibacterales bacterium]|jgi:multiple antibiotic resistance protein|nr:YhgN family NAAT transporter [Vicinamibacterales bacterium]